jgi:Rieske Fe-S protein
LTSGIQAPARRSVLTGTAVAAVAGLLGFLLARNSSAAVPQAGAAANGYGPAAASGGKKLAALSAVPQGGGVVLGSVGVVLTSDAQGGVHAFSATCTHQGCTVGPVRDGRIVCPCHGSEFDARTGAVVRGPATRPLPQVRVVVRDGAVFTA